MTAKSVFITPKTPICVVNEVTVVDDITYSPFSGSVNQTSQVSKTLDELGIKIDTSNLTPEQILRARQVLGN